MKGESKVFYPCDMIMKNMKRDNGNTFTSILPNLLCIVMIAVFLTLFTSWMANVTNRETLTQVCRNYILKMESTGYLTPEMKNSLTQELYDAGMRNIVIQSSTTTVKADYCEDINLRVTGTMQVFVFKVNSNSENNFIALYYTN